MPGHRVRLGSSGRLEIVRTAPPEDAARLRATVATLRAAADAGAVEVLATSDSGGALEVVLAFAGRSPVAPIDARELARIGAGIAADLADLHLRGVSHGALLAEHVLIDATGAVSLCGLGDSAQGTPAADVLALGALLCSLLDEHDTSAPAKAVRAVADRCATGDEAARPTMSAIAAALSTVNGPRRTGTSAAPRPRRDRRTMTATVVVAVGIAVAVAVGIAIVRVPLGSRASSAGDAPTAVARAPRPSTHSTATTTTTVRAERVWPATTETSIIEGHGARWTFGATATQDRVLMGDWNCDGVDTPALVRTRSGAIFVIDDWPDGGEATARYVTTVDGAVDATVEQGPSCDSLAITTTAGERVTPSMRAPGA